jgi:type VI secretion system secreted protein VgrG
MATFTQDKRPLRVNSPELGKDALLLERFNAEEHVSAPYRFLLEMLSENGAIDPATVLRKPLSVTVVIPGGKERHFHGIVNRFSSGGRRGGLTSYRAEVVPQLWWTSLWSDCRIFQNLSVPDILDKVLKGINFKLKLMGTYQKRVYCVQYRETTLAFVSRLMEEEGMFYFHEHTDSEHTLIITDHPSQVPACPAVSEVRMTLTQSYQMAEEPLVLAVEMEHRSVTEKITLMDHDFEKPSANLRVNANGKQKDEIYDYPGNYIVKGEGDRYARVRLEQQEAERELLHGESNCPSFVCGHKFDLTDHPNESLNASYHLLRVVHAASISNYASGAGEYDYTNRFDAIPAAVPYRPPMMTPRALVQGSQTAVVVGPGGEEIYVDKYGRVKVQFFWDREGKKDEHSSCWVRVSAAWAGSNWGFIQIPRIGQEVIVDFLEGNPDQPIITGRVYNAEQMPPYTLPANMTQSGALTRSTKGGSPATANQIRFEDKKGSEQLLVHAEKNQDIEVENDETHWVGHDQTVTIDHDRTEHVKHDETITVDNNRTETVHKNESITVDVNRSRSVGGSETVSVGSNQSISVSGDQTVAVNGGQSVTVGKARTKSVGKDETSNVAGSRSDSVGKDDSLEVAGKSAVNIGKDYAISVGKKLIIDVADEVTIKTGDASVTMKKDGTITIKGKDITLNGSGKINVKASSDVVIKGSKVTQN